MEGSQIPLSIESFSKSWSKPSFQENSLVDDPIDETSSLVEDLDPERNPTSFRRSLSSPHDLSFRSNFKISSVFIVDADELFSNGLVMPIFIDPLKVEASANYSAEVKESSSKDLIVSHGNGKMAWTFMKRYKRSPKRLSPKGILHKYMSIVLKPLYQKFRRPSKKIQRSTGDVSPPCSDLCDIDEAILYCKKSYAYER